MSNQTNILNLRSFITKNIQLQSKITLPSFSNKYNIVDSITTTSREMNINSKTGTITLTGSTGTYNVPQPVINPIPVNTPTAFIQTSNNQVSVTSAGETDTVINSVLKQIINIEDVTNSGYTKNNSVSNLYDSVSSNYWNPQVNEGNINPYLYKLNYTFSGTSKIYKFVVKNNNDFPGFTNIRLYPTSEPLNYVDIEPSTDTNNMYINQTVALLLDQNGNPLFDTNQITAEFTLDPSLQPNTPYQYGQAYGVVYNNNTFGLRTGNYVSTNTGGIANKLDWSYSYLENLSTLTGTNNTSNNYLVSTDGVYRIAQNRTFYQLSTDGGITYTKKTLATSSNMNSTPNGQYVIVSNNTTGYVSNDYGNTFVQKSLNDYYNNYPYFTTLYTGQYQMFVSYPFVSGIISAISVYKNTNYGLGTFEEKFLDYLLPGLNYTVKVIDVIQKIDGSVLVVINARYSQPEGVAYGVVIYGTQTEGNPSLFLVPTVMFSSDINSTILTSLEQNYSNNSNEGQYKTGFGLYNYDGQYGNPCFFVTTNDSTYNIVNNSSLFTEYNLGISNPLLRLQIRNSAIKISNDGSKQVVIVQWYYINSPLIPDIITSYYSTNYGSTWNKSNSYPYLLNSFSNIVANSDFSVIQACGGYYYNYNGNYRTDPISYVSADYGSTWMLNSDINPASSIVNTNFYIAEIQTNKVYFQIKDLNQNQVLGVSDNGFNMTKDLRVNNNNMYVIGGTMTVGPDEESALLNDYTLNVDGTVSARNIVLLSDERFKNIIGNLDKEDAFNKINQIPIVKYKFKDRLEDEREYTGMIAQQLKEIINEAVDINKSTYETSEGIINIEDIYSINYTTIISYLIAAYQHTKIKVNELKYKVQLKVNELNK
jgi:hypothetical protein